jgi:Phage phiEco32-like COOH.NH2 ligase-type 2
MEQSNTFYDGRRNADEEIIEHGLPTVPRPFKIKRYDIKLGTDPEVFFTRDGVVYPAWEFLKSKHEAEYQDACGYMQSNWNVRPHWDGFQAEIEFEVGFACIGQLTHAVRGGLKILNKMAKQVAPDAVISNQSVVTVPEELMASASDEHVSFGCAPSFNIYDSPGKRIMDVRQVINRSSGGHIHQEISGTRTGGRVATDNPYIVSEVETLLPKLIKAQDAILGVWAVGAAANFDKASRRECYGRAGEFRPGPREETKFRFEYRTLSNFWLIHPVLMAMVFELSRVATRMVLAGYEKLWVAGEEEVQQAINTCDVKKAREILYRNYNIFMLMMRFCGRETQHNFSNNKNALKLIYDTGMKGLEYVVPRPEAMAHHWGLDVPDWEWPYVAHGYEKPYGGIESMATVLTRMESASKNEDSGKFDESLWRGFREL